MTLTQMLSRRLRSRQGALARSPQVSHAPVANPLPLGRCFAHAESGQTPPCASCMRAQQQRLRAHYAASAAAAQEWQVKRTSMPTVFS